MDKRTLLGVAICILFYIGYTKYLQSKYPDYGQPPEQMTSGTDAPDKSKPSGESAATKEPTALEAEPATTLNVNKLTKEELSLSNDVITYHFDPDTASIDSARLKSYKGDGEKGAKEAELMPWGPLALQATTDLKQTEPKPGFQAAREGNTLKFTRQQGDWLITQTFTPNKSGYGAEVEFRFKNTTSESKNLDAGVYLGQPIEIHKSSMFLPGASTIQALVAGVDGSHKDELVKERCKEDANAEAELKAENEKIDFLGFDEHYFVKMIQPQSPKFSFAFKNSSKSTEEKCYVFAMASQPQGQVGPGETTTLKFKGYFGPKDADLLAAVEPRLKEVDYLGWFTVIARPLLVAVKALYNVVGNYGLAIIALTIILKILFYPLTRAAAMSMKKMQVFQPQINKIKEKYKDDKQTQQRELMQFMSANKINPAKGCLPILPQIPVFIAFYNVLSHSIELRHAPFFGWIKDLSLPDPYYVTPLLLGVGMLIQQKLTPNTSMDKTQERIMLMMPVIFTVMFFSMPAGMVLYMITNTVVSIAQQQWLNKKLGMKPASIVEAK